MKKQKKFKSSCFGKHKSSDVRILNFKDQKYEYCKNKVIDEIFL